MDNSKHIMEDLQKEDNCLKISESGEKNLPKFNLRFEFSFFAKKKWSFVYL